MKPDKMDISDLLADESFVNYCKGDSPEDVAYWENYIRENADRRLLVEDAREKFFQLFNILAEADLEEQVSRLNNRLDLLDMSEPAPVVQMDRFEKKKILWQSSFEIHYALEEFYILHLQNRQVYLL